jgi:hypothetical protein
LVSVLSLGARLIRSPIRPDAITDTGRQLAEQVAAQFTDRVGCS